MDGPLAVTPRPFDPGRSAHRSSVRRPRRYLCISSPARAVSFFPSTVQSLARQPWHRTACQASALGHHCHGRRQSRPARHEKRISCPGLRPLPGGRGTGNRHCHKEDGRRTHALGGNQYGSWSSWTRPGDRVAQDFPRISCRDRKQTFYGVRCSPLTNSLTSFGILSCKPFYGASFQLPDSCQILVTVTWQDGASGAINRRHTHL